MHRLYDIRSVHIVRAYAISQPRGGGGGGNLVPTMPGCVRPKVEDMGSFRLQMSENISLKMGTKFARSLNMGENLC